RRHSARSLAAGAALWCGIHRGRVCLAGGRPRARGGSAGAGLPRRDGGDGDQRDSRRPRQPARRPPRRGRRPAVAHPGVGHLNALWRDRRSTSRIVLLAAVLAIALAAPLVTSGAGDVPPPLLATRFLPPLSPH